MPPNEFIIAEIRNIEKYLDRIVGLNQEIFQDRFSQPYGIEEYRKKMRDKDAFVMGVLNKHNEDELLGNLIAFPQDSSYYIWLIGIDARIRNQGLGSTLLFECERFAQEQDFPSTSAKTYNVSPEMQRLLLKRDYLIGGFEENLEDPKQSVVYFSLDLEGRDYRTADEKLADAEKLARDS